MVTLSYKTSSFIICSVFSNSAYTEAYNVCSVAACAVSDSRGETMGDEDQGRTSEEEDGGTDINYNRQVSSHNGYAGKYINSYSQLSLFLKESQRLKF